MQSVTACQSVSACLSVTACQSVTACHCDCHGFDLSWRMLLCLSADFIWLHLRLPIFMGAPLKLS